jgi:hypothetical protein
VLGEVAQFEAALYISDSLACMGSVAIDDLKALFASNEVPDFAVAELNTQGIDLAAAAVA